MLVRISFGAATPGAIVLGVVQLTLEVGDVRSSISKEDIIAKSVL